MPSKLNWRYPKQPTELEQQLKNYIEKMPGIKTRETIPEGDPAGLPSVKIMAMGKSQTYIPIGELRGLTVVISSAEWVQRFADYLTDFDYRPANGSEATAFIDFVPATYAG